MRNTTIDAGVFCVPRERWREASEAGGGRRHGLSRSHSCLISGVRLVDAMGMGTVRPIAVRALSCAWRRKECSWSSCQPLPALYDRRGMLARMSCNFRQAGRNDGRVGEATELWSQSSF